jgi:transcription antitermination protein NusB
LKTQETPFTRADREPIEALEPPRIETDELFDNDPKRDSKLLPRRLARERVMQILYAHEVSERDLDELFFDLAQKELSENEAALNFAKELIREFTSHRDEIDKHITERLSNWDFRRVAMIDRLLMQIGLTELLYFPDIPPKATINELIEIAKDYSTAESGKFINGLLHGVLAELKKTGELNKQGRGLIDRNINDPG